MSLPAGPRSTTRPTLGLKDTKGQACKEIKELVLEGAGIPLTRRVSLISRAVERPVCRPLLVPQVPWFWFQLEKPSSPLIPINHHISDGEAEVFRTAEHDPPTPHCWAPKLGLLSRLRQGIAGCGDHSWLLGPAIVSAGREGICLGRALPPGPALPCHTDFESPSVPRDLLYPWVLIKPLTLGGTKTQQRGGHSAARDSVD